MLAIRTLVDVDRVAVYPVALESGLASTLETILQVDAISVRVAIIGAQVALVYFTLSGSLWSWLGRVGSISWSISRLVVILIGRLVIRLRLAIVWLIVVLVRRLNIGLILIVSVRIRVLICRSIVILSILIRVIRAILIVSIRPIVGFITRVRIILTVVVVLTRWSPSRTRSRSAIFLT